MQRQVRRLLKLFRLPFELLEIRTGRELPGHDASMLSASGPQAGQHGDCRAGKS
jgi:hypothetical protein